MSTFKGLVSEFPQIRIDYFRKYDDQPPPLACFLSHVHSDHLLGLESLKAPFVYCSPATKEILLKLEKYPSRMNFAKGILETRRQTYKNLKNLLKTIPLETPTVIELSPGNEIHVTLFDANHCIGAVMFLVQGSGKAILYTGDIRSETWWVDSLVRNPIIVPYAAGIKRLDNVYLDTTFATKQQLYREFPSKANGITELLDKISKYPKDTLFYFHSWTFGYEDVWIALAAFLDSQIHLDPYRWNVYESVRDTKGGVECREAAQLLGYSLGNHPKEGCLTKLPGARIHSCEKGGGCAVMSKEPNAVTILPVITRRDGTDVHELGTGGGKGDLDQVQELEMQDAGALWMLVDLCAKKVRDEDVLQSISAMLMRCHKSSRARLQLEKQISEYDLDDLPEDERTLDRLVDRLVQIVEHEDAAQTQIIPNSLDRAANELPRTITFPYSRHSSYTELCTLISALNPRDIYPCTVDQDN